MSLNTELNFAVFHSHISFELQDMYGPCVALPPERIEFPIGGVKGPWSLSQESVYTYTSSVYHSLNEMHFS